MCFKPFEKHTNTYPNTNYICDLNNCPLSGVNAEVIRLVCCHTFHKQCLDTNAGLCPYCTKPLYDKISSLADAFNSSLLTPTKTKKQNSKDPNRSKEDEGNEEIEEPNNIKDADFYYSAQWETHVDNQLKSFQVQQPSHHIQQSPCLSTTLNSATCMTPTASCSTTTCSSQSAPALNITVITKATTEFWMFPSDISQSALNGNNGSSACTFIALLNSKSFSLYKNQIVESSVSFELTPAVSTGIMVTSILLGNQLHRAATGNNPIHFSIEEALPHLQVHIGEITVEEPLDLTLVSENPAVPQSSVGFYLQRLTNEPNVSAILIINGMSISFVAHGDQLVMMDSHGHGNYGALIAQASFSNVEEFLRHIKELISPKFNMCSLSFITFS